jgi:peptidoglycan-associated lipoprotein
MGRTTTRRWSQLWEIGALATAVLLAASCASGPPLEPITPAPEDPELRERLDQLAAAYESLDVARILDFYSEDPFSVSYDLPYKFDTSGEQHRDTLARFLGQVSQVDVEFGQPLNAWRTNDRAWTTRPFTAAGRLASGETFSFDGWHSAIWTPRDGTWLIAYEHFGGPEAAFASPMPPPAPPVSAAAAPAPPTWPLVDTFFDYDHFTIRDDQKAGLLANAAWLKANPNAIVTIEGHCDERGTDAYNLELGQKRADTVKGFLVEQGVPAERLRTVSYGRSRPFAAGKGEPAWGRNRRAHFVFIRR